MLRGYRYRGKPEERQKHIPDSNFMSKENNADSNNISRERMVQLLNEDLAGEYQAIIAYVVYAPVLKGAAYTDIARELETHASEELAHAIKIAKQIDYLGGMPTVIPKPGEDFRKRRRKCCRRICKMNAKRWSVPRTHPPSRGDGGICAERSFARNHCAGTGNLKWT